MESTEVVVIGAGLIGSAIAWRLAQRKRRVVLLDRGVPGSEASWAGAGLLQPEAGREATPDTLALWLASLDQYADFVGELRDATGAAIEFRICGRLLLAFDEQQEEALRRRARAQSEARIPCQWLGADEVRRREPAVAGDVRAALHFPRHGMVDNRQLVRALAGAAAAAGAAVRADEPALSVVAGAGRVEGVETTTGRIAADVVVNAAGCWSSYLPIAPPADASVVSGAISRANDHAVRARFVQPAKGEIIALEALPRPIQHVLSTPEASLSARGDGRIVVGATVSHGSFGKDLTAAGVARMLAAAVRAVPSLAGARFREAWTGLRPESLDQQPVIGADRITGLYWATGHYKMGILSTPATAAVMVSLIEGQPPGLPVGSLSPLRFEPGGR